MSGCPVGGRQKTWFLDLGGRDDLPLYRATSLSRVTSLSMERPPYLQSDLPLYFEGETLPE